MKPLVGKAYIALLVGRRSAVVMPVISMDREPLKGKMRCSDRFKVALEVTLGIPD